MQKGYGIKFTSPILAGGASAGRNRYLRIAVEPAHRARDLNRGCGSLLRHRCAYYVRMCPIAGSD
jgi:hypothetical protein